MAVLGSVITIVLLVGVAIMGTVAWGGDGILLVLLWAVGVWVTRRKSLRRDNRSFPIASDTRLGTRWLPWRGCSRWRAVPPLQSSA